MMISVIIVSQNTQCNHLTRKMRLELETRRKKSNTIESKVAGAMQCIEEQVQIIFLT